jgi:hypothetical protein
MRSVSDVQALRYFRAGRATNAEQTVETVVFTVATEISAGCHPTRVAAARWPAKWTGFRSLRCASVALRLIALSRQAGAMAGWFAQGLWLGAIADSELNGCLRCEAPLRLSN